MPPFRKCGFITRENPTRNSPNEFQNQILGCSREHRLPLAANVKSLAIFHHDPDYENRFMERMESDARMMWNGATLAREHCAKILPRAISEGIEMGVQPLQKKLFYFYEYRVA